MNQVNNNWSTNSIFKLIPAKPSFTCIGILAFVFCAGCNIQPPGGTPIDINAPLGSVLDEVNRLQEENAEASKFVIYDHEFEINAPLEYPKEEVAKPEFKFRPENRVRGFRLNEFGQDHVASIAQELANQQQFSGIESPQWYVIVERSQNSKHWATRHRYPVHFNRELDEARRRTVVASLIALGIPNAEQLVVIAPAFAEGMDAQDSAQSYLRSR